LSPAVEEGAPPQLSDEPPPKQETPSATPSADEPPSATPSATPAAEEQPALKEEAISATPAAQEEQEDHASNSERPLAGTGASETPTLPEAESPAVPTVPSVPSIPEPEEEDLFVGDFTWHSPDASSESTLRLRQGGQWWHGAHCTTKERALVVRPEKKKESLGLQDRLKAMFGTFEDEEAPDPAQASAAENMEFSDVNIWEMAESLGSWRVVPSSASSVGEAPERPIAVLTCDHCRWTSDHPTATLRMRPAAEQREEIDAMVDEGKLILYFAFFEPAEPGGKRRLELQMTSDGLLAVEGSSEEGQPRHARLRSVQTAVQTLGFTRTYDQAGAATTTADDT